MSDVFNEIEGVAFRDVSCTVQARVTMNSGTIVTPTLITSGTYSIYELNPLDPNSWTVVTNFDEVTIADLEDVLFYAYETWAVDVTGYNFNLEIDASVNNPFPKAGKKYRIVTTLVPVSGQAFVVRAVADVS